MYYGSEFAGRLTDLWAYQHQVTLMFSRPGKPTDNAYIESFNRSFRDECLNLHWFLSLQEAQQNDELKLVVKSRLTCNIWGQHWGHLC